MLLAPIQSKFTYRACLGSRTILVLDAVSMIVQQISAEPASYPLRDRSMDLQPFYYWTVWWTPVVVFILALVLFHAVFIHWPWPLNGRNWKRVDYVWLTMSFISIIGLALQSRQTLSSTYVPLATDQVKSHGQDVIRTLADSVQLNCDIHFTKAPTSPPDFDQSVQQMAEYCSQLRDLQRALGPILRAGQKLDRDVSKDTEYPLAYGFADLRDRLKSNVEAYNNSIRVRQELQRDTARSEGEQALMLFAPFLIALALALRMTKVTAELRPPG
jgi:hypothetical protein